MNYDLFLFLIFSYFCGSIPFGILISGIFKKTDPRYSGSKNIGATNVLRSSGWKLGSMTLLLDILKGFLPVKLGLILNLDYLGLVVVSVILGHIFPIWLKFQGGKGVATFIGVLMGYNLFFFIIFTLSWIITALLFKYSSLSAIIATIINLLFILKFDNNFFYFGFVSLMILAKHSNNFNRLINGQESKIIIKKKN